MVNGNGVGEEFLIHNFFSLVVAKVNFLNLLTNFLADFRFFPSPTHPIKERSERDL